jgi:BCCT, betaine/carnitine/choline family transporter
VVDGLLDDLYASLGVSVCYCVTYSLDGNEVASDCLYLRCCLTIASHVYTRVVGYSNTWAAFVGVFVALISRGRKLWEVVLYGFVIPVVYCLIWFTMWGGIALRQSRQGLELRRLGERYFNNSGNFLVDGSQFCHNVPQRDSCLSIRLGKLEHGSVQGPVFI